MPLIELLVRDPFTLLIMSENKTPFLQYRGKTSTGTCFLSKPISLSQFSSFCFVLRSITVVRVDYNVSTFSGVTDSVYTWSLSKSSLSLFTGLRIPSLFLLWFTYFLRIDSRWSLKRGYSHDKSGISKVESFRVLLL
jgi:hypothetical protein